MERDWNNVTVGVLRKELEQRGMDTSGLASIIAAIQEYDRQSGGGPPPVDGHEEAGKRGREDENHGGSGKKPKTDAGALDNQIIIVIELPHTKTGLVIGKAGNTLRELQDKTGTKLQVAAYTGLSDSRLIQIRGTQAQIDHAKSLISEKVNIPVTQMPSMSNQPGIFSGQQPAQKASTGGPQLTKILLVPNEHVGLAIGKGGETLKMFKSMSGANITVQKEPLPGTTSRPIMLQGQTHEVEQAMMLIMAKMATVGAAVTVQGNPSHSAFGAGISPAYGGLGFPGAQMGSVWPQAGAPAAPGYSEHPELYYTMLLQQQQQQGHAPGYAHHSYL